MPSSRSLLQDLNAPNQDALVVRCNATTPCSSGLCCSATNLCGYDLATCGYGCRSGPCLYNLTDVPFAGTRMRAPPPPDWVRPTSQPAAWNESLAVSATDSSHKTKVGSLPLIEVVVIIVGGTIILAVLGLLLYWWLRPPQRIGGRRAAFHGISLLRSWRHNGVGSSFNFADNLQMQVASEGPRSFSLQEVLQLTDKFTEEKKIGEGGFGTVYRVVAITGEEWVVKRAKKGPHNNQEAFEREVLLIWRMNHRNLVSLVGWCTEEDEQILVYEYICNGDLSLWIHGDGEKVVPLSIGHRLRVAASAARGLSYLHDHTSVGTCVHRDVKTQNILLDEKMEAKVADFGLSKLVPKGGSSFYTDALSGTRGYIDPEYVSTHKVSPMIDVYSFGVVLLELLTGRKPLFMVQDSTGTTPGNHIVTLADWARPFLKNGDVTKIIDPLLEEARYHMKALLEFAEVARQCTERSSHKRPSMQDAHLRLEAIYRSVAPVSPPVVRRFPSMDDDSTEMIGDTDLTRREIHSRSSSIT